MTKWICFSDQPPNNGDYIVAIRATPYKVNESTYLEDDFEWNSVGTWLNGEVWEGGNDLNGFTHWLPLPERPKGL